VLHGGAQALLGAWLGLGSAAPEPTPTPAPAPAEDEPGIVLMAPDLPHDDADERLVAVVQAAARDDAATLHVVRYDPAAFDPAQLVDVSRRRAGEHLASAVLWIDLRGPESYAIFLFERDGGRVLGRRVPIVEGTATAHEIVANIAASVLAESLAGPVTGLAELDPRTLEAAEAADPEPPTPEPAPASAHPSDLDAAATPGPAAAAPTSDPTALVAPAPAPSGFPRMAVSLAYAGQSFARDPLLSHALAVGAAWYPARRTFLGLRYDLVLPLVFDQPAVRLELRRHPVSLEAGQRFAVASRWDLELAGRVTVDPIRRVTGVRGELEPTAARWRTFAAAGAGVGVGFSPSQPIRVSLRVGAEALLAKADYAIRDPNVQVIVAPHPVRGFVELGVAFGWLWRAEKK
jgi:hypothetical protein